jgi:putative transposase
MIRDYQVIHQTWFERGKQRLIKTYGKHRGVKLVGDLKYMLSRYPDGKTVLILDNARIHHAKLLGPFLEENRERLMLMFLPPYSPNLNPIEGLWKWMKEKVIYNVFYKTVPEIRNSVNEFLDNISSNKGIVIDRLCCIL